MRFQSRFCDWKFVSHQKSKAFTLNHPQPSLHSRKLRSLSVLHNTMCRVQYHIIQHNTTNWISDTFNTQGFSPHNPRILHCIWFIKNSFTVLQFECLTEQNVEILISSNSTLDPLRLSLKLDVWMQFCQEFNSWITLQNIQMNLQFFQEHSFFQRFLRLESQICYEVQKGWDDQYLIRVKQLTEI